MDKNLTIYVIIGAVLLFGIVAYAYNNLFLAPATTTKKCVDSDRGADGYVKGTVMYGKVTYLDTCLNETMLKEYYCTVSDALGTKYIACPKKCIDGACIR